MDYARDKRPSQDLTKEELRARIVWRARKVARECEQAIRDGEYWMALPHNLAAGHVLDLEGFRVDRAKALDLLRQLGETP